jgi:hypothetical protein
MQKCAVKVTHRCQSSVKNMKMCIRTIKSSFIEELKHNWSLSITTIVKHVI